MSLDIWLEGPEKKVTCVCPDCGHEHEKMEAKCFYKANITHNLNKMAKKVGIYECLWRPDEYGYRTAANIIPPLHQGIALLKGRPEYYKQFDAPNGWGRYIDFVPWLEHLLQACIDNPDAFIRVWR